MAHLVFLDESGFLLGPLVRRTWAPRGRTPVFYQCGRHREKASALAALSVSPKRRRVRLYFCLASNANIDGSWAVAFLRHLLRHLRGPVVLVWDRLNVHHSEEVCEFRETRHRLRVEWLPPYAPELNPVEQVWGYMKQNPLANLAPETVQHLATVTCRHARSLSRRRDLLRSFIQRGPLSLRLL